MTTTTKENKEKEIFEAKYLRAQEKRMDILSRVVESCTMLEGKKGRGKTITGVALSYNLREAFNMPTICVGSRMGLIKDIYGPYEFIDEREFLDILENITAVSKFTPEKQLGLAIDEALKSMGINILGANMVFDESYKLFDSRTPSDKLVRIFGYLIAQMRHYHLTVLLLTPHRDMVDKRVRRQVDNMGRCFFNKRREKCTVWLRGGGSTWKMSVNNIDQFGMRPNYYDMYDSWTLLGFRKKHLDIKEM